MLYMHTRFTCAHSHTHTYTLVHTQTYMQTDVNTYSYIIIRIQIYNRTHLSIIFKGLYGAREKVNRVKFKYINKHHNHLFPSS